LLEPSIPIRIKPLIGIAEGFDVFLIKAALVSHYRIVTSASDALGSHGEGHAAGDAQQAFDADSLDWALFAGRMLSRSCFSSKVSGRNSSSWWRVMSYSRHWSRWQLALNNRGDRWTAGCESQCGGMGSAVE
jgi:hypothetical protein